MPPRTIRLFKNGRSQAVRIPKELELPGSEVTIRRVGNTLVLAPVERDWAPEFLALLDAEPSPLAAGDRRQPKRQQRRPWS
ncbi:MAG: AbrB/MazE/SpoVT family DNA-binding domain-containing protein [Myxococcaceae bacterium]|nr:AbrB/MazE/SpoVT family DNA-binding domain-containing protein [Myxococcaceae bacterium]